MPQRLLLVPAVMLFLALAPLPYGYYVLLRFVVCGFAIYLAINAWSQLGELHWRIVVPAVIAALFNPFVPVYLNRTVWNVLDLIVGAGFLAAAFARNTPNATRGQ